MEEGTIQLSGLVLLARVVLFIGGFGSLLVGVATDSAADVASKTFYVRVHRTVGTGEPAGARGKVATLFKTGFGGIRNPTPCKRCVRTSAGIFFIKWFWSLLFFRGQKHAHKRCQTRLLCER